MSGQISFGQGEIQRRLLDRIIAGLQQLSCLPGALGATAGLLVCAAVFDVVEAATLEKDMLFKSL